jgi:8-oxo-dGTP pyrophosphatase MutT (NUDIX family)
MEEGEDPAEAALREFMEEMAALPMDHFVR